MRRTLKSLSALSHLRQSFLLTRVFSRSVLRKRSDTAAAEKTEETETIARFRSFRFFYNCVSRLPQDFYAFSDAAMAFAIAFTSPMEVSFSADFTVSVGSRISIPFISSKSARICFPLAGAQEPFSIRATVRFCTFRVFLSCRKFRSSLRIFPSRVPSE